jgi:hypothetical protein
VKASNLPLIVLVSVIVLIKTIAQKRSSGPSRFSSPVIFFLCAWIPLVLWFCWNLSVYGDITGSAEKIKILGWTDKPFAEWLNNKLFTFAGVQTFWIGLLTSFWRGELVFFMKRVALPEADLFYWTSSLLLLALAFAGWKKSSNSLIRGFTAWSFFSLVLYLFLISLVFDYKEAGYPSRAEPFFQSGRLLSAALIPFCILYVRGFFFAFSWIRNRKIVFALFVLVLAMITWSEAIISARVFSSHYNFFHL